MVLHHLAIGTKHLEKMYDFYSKLPGISGIEKKFTENGKFRSFWVFLSSSTILMIEDKEVAKGPEALVFSVYDGNGNLLDLHSILPIITDRTKFTVYISDPDGNRLGYSSYPEELKL